MNAEVAATEKLIKQQFMIKDQILSVAGAVVVVAVAAAAVVVVAAAAAAAISNDLRSHSLSQMARQAQNFLTNLIISHFQN